MYQAQLSHRPHTTWQRWKALPIALGLLSLTFANPVLAQERAQEKMLRTLTVTGRGIEMIPTTLTQVELGVEVQGKTAEAVQQEAAKRSSAVVNLLKARNVEKLQTTGITLNPNYSYENNTQRLVGYIATNTVSFRVDTQRAGTIIDDAVKAGATRVNGVSFVAPDPAIAAAQKQALREATQDAQQQANAVLEALNFTAQEIVSIQVNGASAPPPRPVMAFSKLQRAEMADTPVEGGEQQVDASVTLEIRY
uniref:SIMPL domain-containing protein n=1 Tax=Trichocoleus desertorum TaxID=1481672 RepID=UPI0025B3DD94|nr:SIMPL domain-containing protein [Trichocoleus desertorum]